MNLAFGYISIEQGSSICYDKSNENYYSRFKVTISACQKLSKECWFCYTLELRMITWQSFGLRSRLLRLKSQYWDWYWESKISWGFCDRNCPTNHCSPLLNCQFSILDTSNYILHSSISSTFLCRRGWYKVWWPQLGELILNPKPLILNN